MTTRLIERSIRRSMVERSRLDDDDGVIVASSSSSCFERLGLGDATTTTTTTTTTREDVRRAFRRLVIAAHPDRRNGCSRAYHALVRDRDEAYEAIGFDPPYAWPDGIQADLAAFVTSGGRRDYAAASAPTLPAPPALWAPWRLRVDWRAGAHRQRASDPRRLHADDVATLRHPATGAHVAHERDVPDARCSAAASRPRRPPHAAPAVRRGAWRSARWHWLGPSGPRSPLSDFLRNIPRDGPRGHPQAPMASPALFASVSMALLPHAVPLDARRLHAARPALRCSSPAEAQQGTCPVKNSCENRSRLKKNKKEQKTN